jgi:antirestriction protein ArdC
MASTTYPQPNIHPPTEANAAISTSASPGASSMRGRQEKTATQQLIEENVAFLVGQLEQGQSAALTAYLAAMARFHNYSFGNILQIARCRPEATHVAGMYAWNQLGRYVRRGEKGIPIFAPMLGQKKTNKSKAQSEAGEPEVGKPAPVLVGFRRVYVWDIAQTEGLPLPTLREVQGEAGENLDRLSAFVRSQGIRLESSERIAPAHGVSYGGKIILLPGLSEAETLATLIHETAHELLHKAERRTMTTPAVRETEAEAVAYVVGTALGLDFGSASADYIALWHGNAALLTESLAVIQRTSALILGALEAEQAKVADETAPEVA